MKRKIKTIIISNTTMENLSLHDLLVGYFDSEVDEFDFDKDYFQNLTDDQKIRKSIVENLKRVLQTRQGSVVHRPDFGMPDFMQIYINSGGSINPLKEQIHKVIMKYEPRIEKVTVTKTSFDEKKIANLVYKAKKQGKIKSAGKGIYIKA